MVVYVYKNGEELSWTASLNKIVSILRDGLGTTACSDTKELAASTLSDFPMVFSRLSDDQKEQTTKKLLKMLIGIRREGLEMFFTTTSFSTIEIGT